jgi:hypothetical protein
LAIPIVAMVALECRGGDGSTLLCANAAGTSEINKVAVEIKTNLFMLASSLAL